MSIKSILSFFAVSFMITANSIAQTVVCLGDDATVCTGSPVQINNCGGGQATNAVILNNPSSVNLTDDVWSGVVNIGFTFNFYGINYTQGVIGSNCLFSFNTAVANTGCAWALGGVGALPNAGFATARNTAMLCYSDLNPGTGGNIWYQTLGTAPNRKFVMLFANVPTFSSTDCNYTAMILYETSNIVEYHIGTKTMVPGWNGGLAIQGMENNPGTVAHTTPGRNNTQWIANQDGRRFTPTSPTNTTAYTPSQIPYVLVFNATATQQWGNTLGASFPYNNGTLNIPSASAGTVGYFIAVNGGSCTGLVGAISDTTWITGVSASVTATSTADICSAGMGSVTANPGGGTAGPYTFNWPALGSQNQTVNNVYAGTYQVQMTDGMGCTATANVTVGDTPANYTNSNTLVSCPGGSDGTATVSMVPAIGNISYLWDDPAAQTTQTAVGLSAGTYNCTITSDVGCSNTIAVTVTEIPGMIGNFITMTDVTCNSGNDGVLEVNVTQGTAPYTYFWSGSSSTSALANDLYVGSQSVTITDNLGCQITLNHTLAQPDSLKITDITPNTQICPEDDITLMVQGTGGSSAHTFTWYDGTTNLGTGNFIVVDPSVTNTQYCVVLSEQCGSPTDTKCTMITFPTPIVPRLVPNKPEDCVVGEFEFENTSDNREEIATTFFDFGDLSSTTEIGYDSTSHNYNFVGTYSIYMVTTSIYGCVYEDTIENIVEVLPNPIARFFFSDNPASVFETTVTAYDKSTPDVVTWEWNSPGSIPSSSGLENPKFVFPDGVEGAYEVTLVVTSYHGCTDTLTHLFTVLDDLLFYAPNSFTPDGDEFNQLWRIYVKGTDVNNFNLVIYNRWGEMIWESNDPYAGWDGTYNGKLVEGGTYIWRATMKNVNDDGKVEFNGNINILR